MRGLRKSDGRPRKWAEWRPTRSPQARLELQSRNSRISLEFNEVGGCPRVARGPIWRFPEPPIEFLLVGTRGNADHGKESPLQNADVAQLVEHHLAKVDVASSNLVVRSQDTVTARFPGTDAYTVGWPRGEAAACKAVYTGSNPVPTSVKTMVSGLTGFNGRLAQR